MLSWPAKNPGERLDYSLNYAQALGTDVISASTWTLSSGDIVTDANVFGPKTTTIWLLDGVAGTQYTAINTVTTVAGRIFEVAVTIDVVSVTQ